MQKGEIKEKERKTDIEIARKRRGVRKRNKEKKENREWEKGSKR